MASLQQLSDDVASYLNRQDILTNGVMPGWVKAVETELAETLRSRCQVTSAYQQIDAAYIALPANFAAMESIRDAANGELLELKDEWSGHWSDDYEPYGWQSGYIRVAGKPTPSYAYRLVSNCIEFLPHPIIPNPPDPNWQPQQVLMGWYQNPVPLVAPTDTNAILEAFYAVYLWGVIKQGALFELDNDRAAQADAQYQQVVTRANLWKQQSDYSGAPYREEMAVHF